LYTGPKRTVRQQEANQIISQVRDGHIAFAEALQMLGGTGTTQQNPPLDAPITKDRIYRTLSELDQLVGLYQVKKTVREIFAYLYMQQCRQKYQLKTDPVVLHMVFKGNPGTGKTTVARILANMFRECGVLQKGHLVEVERADLVGEYIGHTAQKTKEVIRKALGGVLFIDEAYSLARGGDKDFGREAIDCLVKGMEDYRNQFIAIIAGYEDEMDWFLSTNPGLPSRFPIHITFPDYEIKSLIDIAKRMAQGRQYRLSIEAEFRLRRHLEQLFASNRRRNFSNARWVRNTLEAAIRRHAVRMFDVPNPSREAVMVLEAGDFEWEGEVR
jgi:stage V sporulation protein K